MNELEDKITRRLAMSSKYDIDWEDTVELTNFLFGTDYIQHRVVDKTHLRDVILKMRKPKKLELFRQRYCGEELCDVERDVSESFDRDFNPNMNEIPLDDGIDKGTFTVTITWEAGE